MTSSVWFWQRIVSPHMAGLAAALAARGRDVTYVAEQAMSGDRASQGWQVPDLGTARLEFAANADEVAHLIAMAPPDSIHICQGFRANGLVGVARSALARRGLRQWVVMETVDDSGWRGGLKRLLYRSLIFLWRKRIEGVLAAGHRTRDWLAARGMPSGSIYPFAYFLPNAPLPSLSSPRQEKPFRLLFAGRFIELKRLDLLLDAFAQLDDAPPVELALAGSGPLEHELRKDAEARHERRVVWLGRKPQQDIPALMAEADCLVLPSRYDGWGAVVSEALMAGTPAICSDACGAAGAVRASGCGGVFPSGDVQALADLLRREVARGRQTSEKRAALASWAHCLGADAGAAYLESILFQTEAGGEPPMAPWEATIPALVVAENAGT
ncbi:MAG: glycosyltransferase family 4 protein [Parvibaculum sp.]|nr:glycosyltransferase family 4 protein [Parvibaculum sp.]